MSDSDDGFVSITKIAKHFSVSISTVRAWMRNGIIKRDTYIKVDKTYRFQLSAIERSLLEHRDEDEDELEEKGEDVASPDEYANVEEDDDEFIDAQPDEPFDLSQDEPD